ncbi:MAG TPA: phosphoadenylyl-sulfate reductase [Bosea sp. (in: a-proteobacteria)]|uniref:phosphoadenylyl-sulfate reductase n=1 Tax=Bosea sp. (in: a-proteobacteria) TaxID=1871050 RepID=UPI002E15B000|nr:phosphoadenylyl-sulfate reductase [Bosea sp. (in: a-proteobacteria)]
MFTTSFGLEDQVLTHVIARGGFGDRVSFVTLDTGRLFPEVYDLWAQTEERYGVSIRAHLPRAEDVERLVQDQGINGFRTSPEARKACCAVRKLVPLDQALKGAAGWITGLRADQSQARADTSCMQEDAERGLVKISPLYDWSRERALDFAHLQDVPLNPLHERGFVSIGCAPCTRAIAPGEPERAGRWWWEQDAAKECGLHVGGDGRLVRVRAAEATP